MEDDFKPEYVVPAASRKAVSQLKKLAETSERVLLAADPDREGEAISWHLAELLSEKNPSIYRITFNEITPSAVRKAVSAPGPINAAKVNAQQARRILDRLVGYKISPLLWRSVKKGLSAGRVQSVAVRLICEREEAIKAFVAKEYWSIKALLVPEGREVFEATLMMIGETPVGCTEAELNKPKFHCIATEQEAAELVARLKDKPYRVEKIEQKARTRSAPPPYITSTLQQDASRRLGFAPAFTMRVAQRLYEGIEIGADTVGLITYMRTDSVRTSEDAITDVRGHIDREYGKDYLPAKANRFRKSGSAQDAHEAVRPTYVKYTPEEMKTYLDKDQLRLYEMVWRRFVASQMAPAKYLSTSVDISAGEFTFRAKGLQILFDGYQKVYGRTGQGDDDNLLPELKANEDLTLNDLKPDQHFTKPPARYNEASLIKELEDQGIGRPSTYASIVRTIQDREYVKKEKRVFYPTELGILTNTLLVKAFPDVLDVGFTARVENQLDSVEEGEEDWKGLLRGFYGSFSQALEAASKGLREALQEMQEETDETCEKCGRQMVKKWGRNGWFLACPGYPECRNAKSLNSNDVKEAGKECPKCGAPLLIRTGKRGEFFACSKYPECDYSSSIGIGIPCPLEDCDGEVTALKGKRGKTFYGCTKYPDCKFISWDLPIGEKCPECEHPFLVRKEYKKKGTVIKCPVKTCQYSRSEEQAGPSSSEAV